MPRKKKTDEAITPTGDTPTAAPNEPIATPIEQIDADAVDPKPLQFEPEQPKNWGPPYKAIYTSAEKGFEMGENRRFKQRVFTFKDKPDEQIIAALKDAGFKYRAEEKAWTVQATPATRELSDQLAMQFAGVDSVTTGRGR
jgi:hypothetical protein